ncbi:MAG: LysR family transcriptional regulator [Eubacterium sp.]|nr:LysR family transcriptional regulator [Eubacterium sp.]
MSVSYEYYKIFYHVAKCKSFNKAASALYNSQPNITRAINNLEKELDCKLFIRSHKGVELTEEGEELFRHVSVAHHQIELGESLISTINDFKSGHITIGMSADVSEGFIHEILLVVFESFHRDYPDIHFQLVHDTTGNLISDTVNNLYDFVIITGEKGYDVYNNELVLAEFRDTIVVGPDFQTLSKSPISLSQLANYPLINLWSQTETYNLYKRFFERNNVTFHPQIELANAYLVLNFVIHNMGIAFVSPKFAKMAMQSKEIFIISLKEELPIRNCRLIASEKGRNNRVAMQLYDRMKQSSSRIN